MGPTKRATISLINGKSCNTLLRMLLECIRSYLQSVLRYKYFKFGYLSYTHTLYHIYIYTYTYTLYLREQGRGFVVIYRSQMGSASKKVCETLTQTLTGSAGGRAKTF